MYVSGDRNGSVIPWFNKSDVIEKYGFEQVVYELDDGLRPKKGYEYAF